MAYRPNRAGTAPVRITRSNKAPSPRKSPSVAKEHPTPEHDVVAARQSAAMCNPVIIRSTTKAARLAPMVFSPAVLEHAVLDVIPGRQAEFEAAFAEARPIIASAPGFRSLRLEQCVEEPSRYLLLVEWERLEDHTEGFRGSAGYERWRGLLHHFYDPFPVVEHYRAVIGP